MKGRHNSYRKFAEVIAPKEADESARRILKSLDHVFAIFDSSLTDPGGDIAHEIPVAPEKSETMKPRNVNRWSRSLALSAAEGWTG